MAKKVTKPPPKSPGKNKSNLKATSKQIKKPFTILNIPVFNKGYQIFVGITVFIAFIVWLNGFLKSDKEKFDEENIEVGTINSSGISNYSILDTVPNSSKQLGLFKELLGIKVKKNKFVTIQAGGHLFIGHATDLQRGIDLFHPIFNGCTNQELKLMVKGDRLYVSAKFFDLETENEIGEIKWNQWVLYKSNMLDYQQSDNKFEVKDKHGNIVFSVFFAEHGLPMLTIAGYFVDNNTVLILNNLELFSPDNHYVNDHDNECQPKYAPNWKTNCQIKMSKIQSVFTIKPRRSTLSYSIVLCVSLFAVIYFLTLFFVSKRTT